MSVTIGLNQGDKTYPHSPGFARFWCESDENKPYHTD